ncbi:MAG: TolC family outer membrane protein [Gammaproteobacteria bacterium]|nr:TolC family outer membrane protein [Gammaproteobacteria bacterium]
MLDSYQQALAQDSDFQAARYQLEASRELLPQSRAVLLPTVNLSADAALVHGKLGDRISDYDNNSLTLSIAQPLYQYRAGALLDQAKATVSQAEVEFAAAQQNLILRLAEAYFATLSAQNQLNYANAEQKAIAQQLAQAQQRFEVGLIAITDVKEAQARYDLAIAQKIVAQQQLSTRREALYVMTQTRVAPLHSLQETMPLTPPEPTEVESWVSEAEQHNLFYQAQRLATQAVQKNIEVARSGHYPSLDLLASYRRQENGGGFLRGINETSSLTLQFNLPLYAGGAVQSQLRQAEALYNASRQQLTKTRRSTQQQSRDAYFGVLAAIAQVKALKQALRSTQSGFEATQAGFDVGTRSAIEVLLAQREVHRAQRDYQTARYDYVLNTLRLKQAVGRLKAEDLKQINHWLSK